MIDAPELMAFLQEEEKRAKNNALDEDRAALISFYNGEPYGDEEDGRSQLVTRDVAEVVDHMTVSVLRTMVSGDKVVEFDGDDEDAPDAEGAPVNPIGAAQQATAAVHYHFMKKGRGYAVLHDSLKAGLLEKTGWVKVYPERPQPKKRVHVVPAELLGEIDAVEAEPVDPDNEAGEWRVAVLEEQPVRYCVLAVPNEEVLIAPDARDLCDVPYIAHRTRKTVSDLRKMGFETDGLSDYSAGWEDDTLSSARDEGNLWFGQDEVDRAGPNRPIWLLEEYAHFDADGDGISELLRIHRVGTTILSAEPADEHPFEYWCPFPMQHRLVGQALADKVADIQRTNSVLLRNAMDSLYIGLAPRTFVHEDSITENTVDDLLTVRPNAIVRWKGAVKPDTLTNQDTSATAFQAIEFMIGQRESRTGITRLNQGLDAESLNKTATGTALMQAQGQQIEEYVARNFAEMLVAPMFAKLYRLMRAYGQPFRMKIDGQVVEVDPRSWPEEIDINIRVGLGSGRKEQRLIYRMQMLGIQQQALQAGLPTVKPEHIYNSVRGLVEDSGLGDPNDFMADPATLEPEEPQPSPEEKKAQADAMLQAEKLKGEQAMSAAKIQLARDEAEAKIELKWVEAEEEKRLARDKAEFEAQLAEDRLAFEERLAARKAVMAEQQAMSRNRPGGSLAE